MSASFADVKLFTRRYTKVRAWRHRQSAAGQADTDTDTDTESGGLKCDGRRSALPILAIRVADPARGELVEPPAPSPLSC